MVRCPKIPFLSLNRKWSIPNVPIPAKKYNELFPKDTKGKKEKTPKKDQPKKEQPKKQPPKKKEPEPEEEEEEEALEPVKKFVDPYANLPKRYVESGVRGLDMGSTPWCKDMWKWVWFVTC